MEGILLTKYTALEHTCPLTSFFPQRVDVKSVESYLIILDEQRGATAVADTSGTRSFVPQ
jgi:hypothetical protein